MAITKTLKVIGRTKRVTLLENLIRKQKKFREVVTIPEMKKRINTKYRQYRINSKKIILQTENMLSILSKEPTLRNAEFVFLDRDALPYMHIARELCKEYGFNKEQFKPMLITREAENHIDTKLHNIITPKEYVALRSNSTELKTIGHKLPLTPTTEHLKLWIKRNIDLKKPIVVIDSGYNGTSVKRIQFLLADISPGIKSYSAMFYATEFAKSNIDYFLGDKSADGIETIEGVPKFNGKLLEINKNGRIKREKETKTSTRAPSQPANAEIFMIALRNQLARYKKEKGIL
jgi:hypothetical protein